MTLQFFCSKGKTGFHTIIQTGKKVIHWQLCLSFISMSQRSDFFVNFRASCWAMTPQIPTLTRMILTSQWHGKSSRTCCVCTSSPNSTRASSTLTEKYDTLAESGLVAPAQIVLWKQLVMCVCVHSCSTINTTAQASCPLTTHSTSSSDTCWASRKRKSRKRRNARVSL